MRSEQKLSAILLLVLTLGISGSLVMANSARIEVTPPCGPWVGCGLSLKSGLFRVFGVPLWLVPLAAGPIAILLGLLGARRTATACLAVAAGMALKGEWMLYRVGWVCPWCTMGTLSMIVAAVLSARLDRFRAPAEAWGAALMVAGLPLALFRSPAAPHVPVTAFPPRAKHIKEIDRQTLVGSDDVSLGASIFIGHPRAPGAGAAVIPWAKGKMAEGRRLIIMPLEAQGDMANALLLSLAWQHRQPGWEALFDPNATPTFPFSPKERLEEQGKLQRAALQAKLLGFHHPPILIDCPPNESCHQDHP